jgi:hypothetical protein
VGKISDTLLAQLLRSSTEQAVVWLSVLAVLIAVAVYVIGKVRSSAIQKEPTASNLLSKFRESHCRGDLSDEEFRTIKTTLATQLQQEIKDSGDKDQADRPRPTGSVDQYGCTEHDGFSS